MDLKSLVGGASAHKADAEPSGEEAKEPARKALASKLKNIGKQ